MTAQVVLVAFDFYLIPFALFLGATAQQIGWLVAVPNFLSSMSQLVAARLVRAAGSRRRVLVVGMALQAVLLLPLIVLPVMRTSAGVTILILLVAVFRVIGSVMGPAWGSLVSDYLPEGQRGEYFGWRWRMVSLAGIAGAAFWGLLLYALQHVSPTLGFVLLFAGAATFRFLSFRFMSKMADVPLMSSPDGELTLWLFLRRFRENNFVKFIFYVSAVTFAQQIAAPYFRVHMLTNLEFSYLSYTSVQLASVIAGLIAFPIWGSHADLVGTARVLKVIGLLVPLVPLLWMFARDPVSLIIVEAFSGFVWSGFTLASANFVYDAVPPNQRVRGLAYFNLFAGAAVFSGAALGGWLAERLPPILGEPLVGVFLASAVTLLFAGISLSRSFEEVRSKVHATSHLRLFLSVLGVKPLVGPAAELDIYPPLRTPREDTHREHEPAGRA